MDLIDFKLVENLYKRYRFMSQESLVDEVVELAYKHQKISEVIEDFDRGAYSSVMFKVKRGLDENTPITLKDRVVAFWEWLFAKRAVDYVRSGMLQTGVYESKKLTFWERVKSWFKKSSILDPKEQYTAQELKKVSKGIKQAVLK